MKGTQTMPKYINLTPHVIVVRTPVPDSDGNITSLDVAYPPLGKVARVEMAETVQSHTRDGVPVITRRPGRVILPEGLEINATTYLIVSSMVLEAAERIDMLMLSWLIAPDTGDTAIRNDKGQVVAVTRWVEPNIRRVGPSGDETDGEHLFQS